MAEPKKKNPIFGFIRAAIGLGLAAFFIFKVLEGIDVKAQWEQAAGFYILAAFLVYGSVIPLCIYRWQMLLKVQGIELSFWDLTRLTMIGIFWNVVVPGAVGGDLLKMAYLTKQAPDKKTEGVLTIMVDRIVGLLGLFVVASASVLLALPFIMESTPQIKLAAAVVGGGSLGGIIAVLIVEFRQPLQRLPGVGNIIDLGARKLPEFITNIINRVVTALDLYSDRKGVIVYALLIAVAVHSLNAGAIICAGKAFHENQAEVKQYFLATQVGNAVGAIPATPGGLGTRDVVLSHFLEQSGAEEVKAAMIPACFSLVIAGWSMIGGLFFVFIGAPVGLSESIEGPVDEEASETDKSSGSDVKSETANSQQPTTSSQEPDGEADP